MVLNRDAGAHGSAQPLRVLHVVSSGAFAGLERHVLGLTRELCQLGCDAEIACPPSAEQLRAEAAAAGVLVHPAGTRRTHGWLLATGRELVGAPPQAVHVHDGRAAAIGIPLARVAGGLVIRTQHFTRPASMARRPRLVPVSVAFHQALNRGVDGYIAVSEAAARGARQRHETGTALVEVIAPGIALPWEEAVAQASAARRKERHPVIAYMGRLEAEKRLDVLLEALPSVLERVPHCRLIIAGSGSIEGDLRQMAARLNIEHAVEWIGWVSHPDAVLEQAHVYVNTWPWEGFGMAMAEASAFGVPVVATNAGASPEVVVDGVTGILVAPADPAALASTLVDLAQDLPKAAAMGAAGRIRAVERYGIRRTAEETLRFYRRLQAQRRP